MLAKRTCLPSDSEWIKPSALKEYIARCRAHCGCRAAHNTGQGFWLFGVNKRPGLPSLFDNVRWSGPHARADVQANLPSSFRLTLLETLQDLDEEPDWRRWNANKLR